jgi:anti-sigma28 factor (negative regulator of flagellin synthesis)
MAETTSIKRREKNPQQLQFRPKTGFAQSATFMSVLRKARLVALKEQIRKGAYRIGGKKVADALIRETMLDEMLLRYADVLTIEEVPTEVPAPVEPFDQGLRFFSKITVERFDRPLHTLWQVIGWGQNGERYTLAVCLKETVANAMRSGLMKKCQPDLCPPKRVEVRIGY